MGEQQVHDAHRQQWRQRQPRVGQLQVGGGFRLVAQVRTIAFTGTLGLVALALEKQHAGAEHEDRADHAQPRRCPGGGVEEGAGDDVLDLWRAGQGVHGERERAQGNGRRDQALGDVALAEHFSGKRIDREHHHKQRYAAVGQQGADQHDHQHRLAGAEQANRRGDDGAREAGQFDQLAEHCAEQEHREIQLDETDHFFHEHPGESGGDGRGVGEQDGAEGGNRGKKDNAVATVGSQHQQREGCQGNDHTHGVSPGLLFLLGEAWWERRIASFVPSC
ncbi:hypothetical protein D3C80_808000 [compost metagenome]